MMTAPTGEVLAETVVRPGGDWAQVVRCGERLRIVDLEGKQAVDFLCYNATPPEERYSAADTVKYAGTSTSYLAASTNLPSWATKQTDLWDPPARLRAGIASREDNARGKATEEFSAVLSAWRLS